MPMTMRKVFNSVTFATSLLVAGAAYATDDDDRWLSKQTMMDSQKAYYTASVIVYPTACKAKLSDKMKDAAARMAAAHGEQMMRVVRAKLLEPALEGDRTAWCGTIAKFIEGVERENK